MLNKLKTAQNTSSLPVPKEALLDPPDPKNENAAAENPDIIKHLSVETKDDNKESEIETQICAAESRAECLKKQQQKMEEENKKRKEMINKAIKDR